MSLLSALTDRVVERFFRSFDESCRAGAAEARARERLREAVSREVLEAERWSAFISAFGLIASPSTSTDNSTLPLTISSIPRKFRSPSQRVHEVSEAELIDGTDSLILLGDPGSGKTTAVKRLVRRLLFESPVSGSEYLQVPVVGVLREIKEPRSVFDVITHCFGISESDLFDLAEGHHGQAATVAGAPVADDRRRAIAAAELLDRIGACLFLDGLDEISTSDALRTDLVTFVRLLNHATIIVTCRSGDYQHDLEGLRPIELCPLTREQILQIANMYLGKRSAAFLSSMSSAARELADRPLFMLQMLLLFDRSGSIPERPAALCRTLLRASLVDWDAQRKVSRASKYADFDTDRKIEFLGALAYELLVRRGARHFGTGLLETAYKAIHLDFDLPAAEAHAVAAELETHTGIIVQSGGGFEFSHLSLQEYLAADHIVRLPEMALGSLLVQLLPSVVAVCVSLSADSGSFFAETVLNSHDARRLADHSDSGLRHPVWEWGFVDEYRPISESLHSFLVRVVDERPTFRPSDPLGLAAVRLLQLFPNDVEIIRSVLRLDGVSVSLASAIVRHYEWSEARRGSVVQMVRREECTYRGAPDTVYIEGEMVDVIRASTEVH